MITPQETTVHIEALKVPVYVGLHAPERELLQTVIIDVDCELAEPQVTGDDLGNSADYVPVADAIRALCLAKKRRLIETLAEEIAAACFAERKVRKARIRIRKPEKIPNAASVGVTRTFVR